MTHSDVIIGQVVTLSVNKKHPEAQIHTSFTRKAVTKANHFYNNRPQRLVVPSFERQLLYK